MNQPSLNASTSQLEAPLPIHPSTQPVIPDSAGALTRSIAFVDTRLAQVDQLAADIDADRVVLIDTATDGIDKITQTLSQYNSLSSVHIFSHGSSGSLQLGNAALNADSLSRYSQQLSQWGSALLGKADLMLYGCNFTADEQGLSLAQQISSLTGADVAASNNLTGASSLGGDWELETHIGQIESAIALSPALQSTYESTLNLLDNGDFESGLANWARFSGSETTTTEGALSGQSVQITGANSGIGQNIRANPGDTFILQGSARSSSTSGYTGFGIDFLDANRRRIDNNGQRINTNSWTDYEIEATAVEGTQFVRVWAYKQNDGGAALLDNLELTLEGADPSGPSGSQERIANSGFEAGLANWTVTTGTETISTTESSTGSQSVQLSEPRSGVRQIVVARPGEDILLSLDSKTTNTGYVGAGLNFFDANFRRLDVTRSNPINIRGNNWQTYQQSATAPAGTRYAQAWTFQSNSSGDTFLDNISLSAQAVTDTDTAAPAATLSASDLTTAGINNYDFTVTYSDATAVDISSIDANDIVVTGPNGFSQNATQVSTTPNSNGTPRTATYRLAPPVPDGWTAINNGTYTVRLKANQVEDTLGNQNTASDLGSFAIDIESGSSNFGNVRIQQSAIAVNEADGTATVTVVRTDGSDGTITVDYGILDQTATRNADFTPVDGTLTFAPGETEQSITINILDDDIEEDTESFGLGIDNVRGGATLLAPRTATITIADDDTDDSGQVSRYRLTTGAKTWEAAQAEALSLGGNLVTINNAAEEAQLKANFGTTEQFWIGLTDRDSEGTFEWVNGEAVLYTNWAPGEPNDFGTGEDYAQINFGPNRQWNDLGAAATRRGIIEIKGNPVEAGDGNGLLGEYFNNIDFTSKTLNRTDSTVNFDWNTGSPSSAIGNDTFSVRWSGRIEPLYSETYTFQTTTDDGVRLFVNDQLVINQFIDQAATAATGTIALEAGQQYDIRMEYYERGGDASAELAWSSPSQPFQIVPRSQLYSEDAPAEEVLVAETVVTGLTQPTSIEWQPNTNRMFISEKSGVVKIFENGTLQAEPFIDISPQVNGRRDRGLLDIAIHPNFPSTPYVYLLYTYDPPEVFNNLGTEAGPDGSNNRAARLTRVTADASTNFTTAVEGSEVVLVGKNSTWDNYDGFVNSTPKDNIGLPEGGVDEDGNYIQDILVADSESHTIGGLAFAPDGSLYLTNGDGASYNRVDPRATRVQDIDSLSGKVLRIDPITGAGLPDNPFFNGDPNANRSKVWQYGLRNPFRITVNETSGELYIGDVGLSTFEEINGAGPGANFGWPFFEGGDGVNRRTPGYDQLPEAIAFYNSDQTATPALKGFSRAEFGINAIILGDLYTGNAYPSNYQGDLFFNDLAQGIVRNASFDANGNISNIETFTTGANAVVHIEEGPDDALYYTALEDGEIGRWVFSTAAEGTDGDRAVVPPAQRSPSFARRRRSNRPDFFLGA